MARGPGRKIPVDETKQRPAEVVARSIPGQPGRAVTIASVTFAAGFLSVAVMDPTMLGALRPGWTIALELAILGGIVMAVVAVLYLAGRSVVEIGPDQIVVRRAFRTTRVPWDSLIRYQCDPAFAEMALVFAESDRRGRRHAAWVSVSAVQARAILDDPRSEWVPVEGRLTLRARPA